jgi:hypothetical protein
VYTVYLFTQGRGGWGELNKSEGKRGNSSQSWVENTNMTDFIACLLLATTPLLRQLERAGIYLIHREKKD